jgi:hypothetical protein
VEEERQVSALRLLKVQRQSQFMRLAKIALLPSTKFAIVILLLQQADRKETAKI